MLENAYDASPNDFGQSYRDGATHCIFGPIKQWVVKLFKAEQARNVGRLAQNKRAQRTYSGMLTKLTAFELKYDAGIDAAGLQELVDSLLTVGIVIRMPLSDKELTFRRTGGRVEKWFRFVNVRLNHCEPAVGPLASDFPLYEPKQSDIDRAARGDVAAMSGTEIEMIDGHEAMQKIKCELAGKKEFFLYRQAKNGIREIMTYEKRYKLEDPVRGAIDEFVFSDKTLTEHGTGKPFHFSIQSCGVCAMRDPRLSDFVRLGCHFPLNRSFLDDGQVSPVNDYGDISSIDLNKAYAQFSASSARYKGFLAKITDHRATKKIQGVGLYRIVDIDTSKVAGKMAEIMRKMPVLHEGNVYPSPLLEFYQSHGVQFRIVEGCWGSAGDFEFPAELFEKDVDGVRGYARATGQMVCSSDTSEVWTVTNKQYARHLQESSPGNKVEVSGDEDENGNVDVRIAMPKSTNKHLSHISAFITGYMHMSVVQQLLEMDIPKVKFVCSDGIFYESDHQPYKLLERDSVDGFHGPQGKELWEVEHDQHARLLANLNPANETMWSAPFGDGQGGGTLTCAQSGYCLSGITDQPTTSPRGIGAEMRHQMCMGIIGPGGSGKTHLPLTDRGFHRVGYVALSWRLVRSVVKEYALDNGSGEVTYVTRPGNQRNPAWRERLETFRKNHSVVIIDEISMLTQEDRAELEECFRGIKLIFVGDSGYQLPPVVEDGAESMDVSDLNPIKLTKTRRFFCESCKDAGCKSHCERCKPLNDLVRDMRFQMGGRNRRNAVRDTLAKLKDRFKSWDAVVEDYDLSRDLIIAARHRTNEMFKRQTQGRFPADQTKWFCTRSDLARGAYTGTIETGEKPKGSWDEHHVFTCHVMQGQTLGYNDRLVIDISDMRDCRMLYTALTRARTLDQIILTRCPHKRTHEQRTGRLYEIRNKHREGVYVGHTFSPIGERLEGHWRARDVYRQKRKDTKDVTTKGYCGSFALLHRAQKGHVIIKELKAVPGASVSEMVKLERQMVDTLVGKGETVLNLDLNRLGNEKDIHEKVRQGLIYDEPVNLQALEQAIDENPEHSKVGIAVFIHASACKNIDSSGVGHLFPTHRKNVFDSPQGGKLEYGRRYAHGASLQKLPRVFRTAGFAQHHIDIDIVNCHPILLSQVIHKFTRKRIPCLDFYINNREGCLGTVMEHYSVDRSAGKVMFLQLLYGGALASWRGDHDIPKVKSDNNFALLFEEESHKTQACVVEMFGLRRRLKTEKGNNASYTSLYLQDLEDQILTLIEKYLRLNGIQPQCLMYDGLSIPNLPGDTVDALMRGCELFVEEEMGFKLQLERK